MPFHLPCGIMVCTLTNSSNPPQVSVHSSNPFQKIKTSVTAYEKDLLTGKILKQLYPESNIRINGFEEIPEKEQNSYDVIASNIPLAILPYLTFLIPEVETAQRYRLPEAYTITFSERC
jgi:phospholipid N-methyltransferase